MTGPEDDFFDDLWDILWAVGVALAIVGIFSLL